MSYETAPACKMLATHCASCGKPLLDAKSVEVGLGPDCRKRLFKARDDLTDEQRKRANKLVYDIALDQSRTLATLQCAAELRELGFDKLADRVVKGCAKVQIEAISETTLAVRAPFSAEALTAWHSIQGRKWDPASKRNLVPANERVALYQLLVRYYPGTLGIGPKGPFVLGATT